MFSSSARFGPPQRKVDSSSPPKKVLHLLKTSGRLITSLNGTQRRPSVITAAKPMRRNSTSSPRQTPPSPKAFTFDDADIHPQSPMAPPAPPVVSVARRRSTISRQSSSMHKAQQVELRHMQRIFQHWKRLYLKQTTRSPFLAVASRVSASRSVGNHNGEHAAAAPDSTKLSRIWRLQDEPRMRYSSRHIKWMYSALQQWHRRAQLYSSSRLIAIDHHARFQCHSAMLKWISYIQFNHALPIAVSVVAKARCRQVQLMHALHRWCNYRQEVARRYDRERNEQHKLYMQLALQYCQWRGWKKLLLQLQKRYQVRCTLQAVVFGGIPLYHSMKRWKYNVKQTYHQTSKLFQAALQFSTSQQVKCLVRLLERIERGNERKYFYKRADRFVLRRYMKTWLWYAASRSHFNKKQHVSITEHIANQNLSHQYPQVISLTRMVPRLSACLRHWRKYCQRRIIHNQALSDSDEIFGYVMQQMCLRKWLKRNARYRNTVDKFRRADIVLSPRESCVCWSRKYLSRIFSSMHHLAKTMHHQHLIYRRASRFSTYRTLRKRRVWLHHWYTWMLNRQQKKMECLKSTYRTATTNNVLSVSDMLSLSPMTKSKNSITTTITTATQTPPAPVLKRQVSVRDSTPSVTSSASSLAQLQPSSPLTPSQLTRASRESQTDIDFEISPLTPFTPESSTNPPYSPIRAVELDDISIQERSAPPVRPTREPQPLFALYSRHICALHFAAWKSYHIELLQLPFVVEEESEIASKHFLYHQFQIFMRRLVSFSVTAQMNYIADAHYLKHIASAMLQYWHQMSKVRRKQLQASLGKPPLGRPPLPREPPHIRRSNLL